MNGTGFIFLFVLFTIAASQAGETIDVYKQGVLHKFIRFNKPIDNFIELHFKDWENETFEIFEQVKDSQGIAIDLGAWIGTTSIWLANYFYHVIAVEADKESLECLRENLAASDCINFSVCECPILHLSQEVLFGPRGKDLNESISCVKTKGDNINDYFVESITLEKLIFDYVYSDKALYTHKIGFIKCDIEGGEEEILEDLLRFSYTNRCKVYLSFHVSWWRTRKIEEFASLFGLFKTNCPEADVVEYIRLRPFTSLLFEPI